MGEGYSIQCFVSFCAQHAITAVEYALHTKLPSRKGSSGMSSYNGGNSGMGILGMVLMVIGGIVVAYLAIGLIGLLRS